MPIAVRKGIRSCTKHMISNYLSYSNLSSPYWAVSVKITDAEAPTSIHEALKIPEWKATVMEEMQALKRMIHGILWSYQKGNKQWAANGFSTSSINQMAI